MTKEALGYLNSYEKATATNLNEVYGRCSKRKRDAETWCRKKCSDMNGYGFRIMTHNCFFFTCGWMTVNKDGKETLHVETAYKSFEFEI